MTSRRIGPYLAVAGGLLALGLIYWVYRAATAGETLVVVSWDARPAQAAAERALIGEFGRINGRVRVIYRSPSFAESAARAGEERRRFDATGGGDVVCADGSTMAQLMSTRALADLQRVALTEVTKTAATVYAPSLGPCTVGQSLLSLPMHLDVACVFLNRDLLQQFHIPNPAPGWSWWDYVRTAKRLTRDTSGDGQPDVYGTCRAGELAIRLAQEGIRLVDESALRFTTRAGEVTQALEFYVNLDREWKATVPSGKGDDLFLLFAAGKTAMFASGSLWATELAGATDYSWAIVPPPRGQSGAKAVILGGRYLAISGRSHHPREAWQFINFCTSKQGQELMVEAVPGLVSPRSDLAARRTPDEPAGLDQVRKELGNAAWVSHTPVQEQFRAQVWEPAVARAVAGNESPAGAIQWAAARAQAWLKSVRAGG